MLPHRLLASRFIFEILMQTQRQFAKSIQRFLPVRGNNTAIIFVKNHVQLPMQALDFPMISDYFQKSFRRGIQTADVVICLRGFDIIYRNLAFYREHVSKPRPFA